MTWPPVLVLLCLFTHPRRQGELHGFRPPTSQQASEWVSTRTETLPLPPDTSPFESPFKTFLHLSGSTADQHYRQSGLASSTFPNLICFVYNKIGWADPRRKMMRRIGNEWGGGERLSHAFSFSSLFPALITLSMAYFFPSSPALPAGPRLQLVSITGFR
ncbi:hypothetical protein B0T17DRAFT_7920 [Bombardia bombarda]|uniref:Secreted protein n=1 Tax=Bombardia bombarda TaxID=252184 RepID=A0AA40CEJ0_9PEZI|nr:hypothetical protein B0T17DRAFT_7920 [Bombardia bombarda]